MAVTTAETIIFCGKAVILYLTSFEEIICIKDYTS